MKIEDKAYFSDTNKRVPKFKIGEKINIGNNKIGEIVNVLVTTIHGRSAVIYDVKLKGQSALTEAEEDYVRKAT